MNYAQWKDTRTEANSTNTVLLAAAKLELSPRTERILSGIRSKRTVSKIRKLYTSRAKVTNFVTFGEKVTKFVTGGEIKIRKGSC
jgi:hypothetical protein